MSAGISRTPDMYMGKKFGRLTVTGPEFRRIKNKKKGYTERCVYCKCDCGKENVPIAIAKLFTNDNFIKSCGCAREEQKAKFAQGRKDGTLKTPGHPIHGDSVPRSEYYNLHHIWVGMRRRCNNPNDKSYPDYGGKGIKVCPEWNDDYLKFKEWALNNGYIKGLSIDRLDNIKGYYPDNCRWASDVMQANNKSNNRLITVEGVSHTSSEWSRFYGLNPMHGMEKFADIYGTTYEGVIERFKSEKRPHKPFIIVNQLQYEKGCEELKNKEKKNNE